MLACMSDTAHDAPPEVDHEMWSASFTLHFTPDALAPFWINCEVGYRTGGPHPQPWVLDGIASFDAPTLLPPREGSSLIPYLIYHIDEIKSWLTEEHVRRVFNGQEETIRKQLCLSHDGERGPKA